MLNGEKRIERPLRWGMIGGGRTGNVGYKHRLGALRDNTAYELVAGAFDLDFERCKDFGMNLGVAEDRLYPDYKTMFEEEAKRPDGVEVVSIATPNFTHYEITKAALEAGLHVICEKPLFFKVEQGEEIKALAEKMNKIVGCFINIFLDILLVVGLDLGVEGAAIATLIAQAVSAILVVRALMQPGEMYLLEARNIRFHRFLLKSIVTIGLPAGIQSVMYNISNIIIQTSLNNLGTDTMAAYTAFGKMDAIYWMISGAFSIAITTFVGQNYGAGKYSRMKRSVFVCLFMDFIASILVSALFLLFGSYIFRMFTQDPEVIKVGMKIIQVIAPSYVLFIFIEILSSALRGIGDVLIPMIMTCGGVCLLRIFWIFAVVPHIPGIQSILMSYPISWALTAVLFIIYYFVKQKKFYRSLPGEEV